MAAPILWVPGSFCRKASMLLKYLALGGRGYLGFGFFGGGGGGSAKFIFFERRDFSDELTFLFIIPKPCLVMSFFIVARSSNPLPHLVTSNPARPNQNGFLCGPLRAFKSPSTSASSYPAEQEDC